MRAAIDEGEKDCAGCASVRRCWKDPVVAGSGFVVRRSRPLAPGEILHAQGAPFGAPFIVTRGCVAIMELQLDGVERIVGFRVPGELVGLESWNQQTHRYGAQALVASAVCRLRWGRQGTAPGAALLRALLAKTTSQLADASMPWPGLPARERVQAFLRDFRSRTDQPLPMTRAQIGKYLGMAEETVVRAMKTLPARGAV